MASDPGPALIGAYRGVAPVIVASALTIAAALFCLIFSTVGMLAAPEYHADSGLADDGRVAEPTSGAHDPGVSARAHRTSSFKDLTALAADRHRGGQVAGPRWSSALPILLVCMLPLLGIRFNYDVPRAQPATTESNRGYSAIDEHFPPDRLLPEIVVIQSDHDLRTGRPHRCRTGLPTCHGPPWGGISPVRQPAGRDTADRSQPDPPSRPHRRPAGANTNSLTPQLDSIESIQATLAQLQLPSMNSTARLGGATEAPWRRSAPAPMTCGSGVERLQGTVATVSGYMAPLRQFVDATPDCPTNLICSSILKVLDPVRLCDPQRCRPLQRRRKVRRRRRRAPPPRSAAPSRPSRQCASPWCSCVS